eukprot:scaffold2723_cov108-Isochrysis_galbana.AAC.23
MYMVRANSRSGDLVYCVYVCMALVCCVYCEFRSAAAPLYVSLSTCTIRGLPPAHSHPRKPEEASLRPGATTGWSAAWFCR